MGQMSRGPLAEVLFLLWVTLLELHFFPGTLGWTGEEKLDQSSWEPSQHPVNEIGTHGVSSWQHHMADHRRLLSRRKTDMEMGPSRWKHESERYRQLARRDRRRVFHSSTNPRHSQGGTSLAPRNPTSWENPRLPRGDPKYPTADKDSEDRSPEVLPAIRMPARTPRGQEGDTQNQRDLVPGVGITKRPTVPAPLEQRSRHAWERSLTRFQLRASLKTANSSVFVSEQDALTLNRVARSWKLRELSTSWVASRPCSSWLGVMCDENGRVVSLILGEKNLQGVVPLPLGQLDKLQTLSLPGCNLRGSIPTSLGNLTSLVLLDLCENQLKGSIPSRLGFLTQLKTLLLCSNELRGVIPPQLSKLSRLTDLRLYSNCLTGRIPSGLFKIISLEYIALSQNRLAGSIRSLGSLVNLQTLQLSQNKLSGRIPESVSALRQIRTLDLSSNGISGTIPRSIWSLTKLSVLYLGNNKLEGSIPASVSSLKNLEGLGLNANLINGSIPVEVYQLTNLTLLDLSQNSLSGPLSRNIGQLKNLQYLWITSSGLENTLPKELGQMTALLEIYLSDNQFSGGIPATWRKEQELTWISLAGNSLDGPIPKQLGELKKLQYLLLCKNSLTGNIPQELTGLLELTYLDLSYNVLTGNVPQGLRQMTKLQKLNLGYNQLNGRLDVFTSLTSLSSLSIEVNLLSGVIPASIGELSGLQKLNLQQNNLGGTIPRTIGDLFSLTFLNLANNNLTGTIPAALGNLRSSRRTAGLSTLNLGQNRFYGSLPSGLTELDALTYLSVAFNYLTGPVPEFPQQIYMNDFSNNYFTSGCPYGLFVESNCISTPCNSLQRTDAACSEFCNALDPKGPCSGNGFCVLAPSVDLFVCNCSRGYATPGGEEADYGSCVPKNGSRGGIPVIPVPNITEPQGISILDPKFERMNKWSRYLSVRSRFSNRVVTWDIYAASTWMSPSEIFLGFNPVDGNENVTNVLTWSTVRDQDKCETCWAYAAADVVGGATLIARNTSGGNAVIFSINDIAQNITKSTCAPGFPTNALEYAIDKPLVPETGNTTMSQVPPVVMYESVRFRGWFGLVLTLHNQPALVILDGSSPSFQDPRGICSYKAYVFNKDDCFTGRLGHSVVITGYDLTAPTPYWVIRNSWGSGWCNGGFMRLAMRGGDGMCGMNVYPAYYPIPAPNEGDPCYTNSVVPDGEVSERRSLNPCGGGLCIPKKEWGPYGYMCDCTVPYTGVGRLRRFVAVNNTVNISLPNAGLGVTQSCVPVDACELSLKNPCKQGTCVNDGKGGYSCLCFPGFRSIRFSDGSPTCAAGEGQGSSETYVVPGPEVTCDLVAATFNLSTAEIAKRNKINCSLGLKAGDRLNVSNPDYACSILYSVTFDDQQCSDIVKKLQPRIRVSRSLKAVNFQQGNTDEKPDRGNKTEVEPPRVTEALLKQLNPYINCSSLRRGQMICLRGDGMLQSLTCSKLYTLKRGETCTTIITRLYGDDPPEFYLDNPGIDCAALEDPSASSAGGGSSESSDFGGSGQTICVSSTDVVGGRACGAALVPSTWPSRGCRPAQVKGLKFASVTAFEAQNFPCNANSPSKGASICSPK